MSKRTRQTAMSFQLGVELCHHRTIYHPYSGCKTEKTKMKIEISIIWIFVNNFKLSVHSTAGSLSNWTPPPGPSFWLGPVLGGSKLKTLNNNLQCTHIFTDKRTCFLTGTYVECSVFPSFSLYVTCFCQNH